MENIPHKLCNIGSMCNISEIDNIEALFYSIITDTQDIEYTQVYRKKKLIGNREKQESIVSINYRGIWRGLVMSNATDGFGKSTISGHIMFKDYSVSFKINYGDKGNNCTIGITGSKSLDDNEIIFNTICNKITMFNTIMENITTSGMFLDLVTDENMEVVDIDNRWTLDTHIFDKALILYCQLLDTSFKYYERENFESPLDMMIHIVDTLHKSNNRPMILIDIYLSHKNIFFNLSGDIDRNLLYQYCKDLTGVRIKEPNNNNNIMVYINIGTCEIMIQVYNTGKLLIYGKDDDDIYKGYTQFMEIYTRFRNILSTSTYNRMYVIIGYLNNKELLSSLFSNIESNVCIYYLSKSTISTAIRDFVYSKSLDCVEYDRVNNSLEITYKRMIIDCIKRSKSRDDIYVICFNEVRFHKFISKYKVTYRFECEVDWESPHTLIS